MADLISAYLANDTYAPSVPKPHHQQHENYQIYNLYSTDLEVETIAANRDLPQPITTTENILFKSVLAVQAVHIQPISFNFESLINRYPGK